MDKPIKEMTHKYILFSLAWALGYCFISLATSLQLLKDPAVTGLLMGGMVLLAIRIIKSYLGVFEKLDEMLKRIQLEGLSIGFGISFLTILAYAPFHKIGAPTLNIDFMIVIFSVSMAIGIFIANRRMQ